MKEEKKVESFWVMSDSGDEYKINVYRTIIRVPRRGGNYGYAEGMERLATDDGDHVNEIDDDTFELVSTGKILRRIKDS
jgi:hypothetical protein